MHNTRTVSSLEINMNQLNLEQRIKKLEEVRDALLPMKNGDDDNNLQLMCDLIDKLYNEYLSVVNKKT